MPGAEAGFEAIVPDEPAEGEVCNIAWTIIVVRSEPAEMSGVPAVPAAVGADAVPVWDGRELPLAVVA